MMRICLGHKINSEGDSCGHLFRIIGQPHGGEPVTLLYEEVCKLLPEQCYQHDSSFDLC
jgi:hypothetical protein